MSVETLRAAAEKLEGAAYVHGLGPALPESLALLLVNEANAMDGARERGDGYNVARADLLTAVARAVLGGDA